MFETIRDFIRKDLLSGRDIGGDDQLLLSGLVDSLGVMRMVAFLEKTYGFKIPAGDLKITNFGTVNSIVAYIENRS